MGLGKWFASLFDKAQRLMKKLWALALPFLQEALSEAAAEVWKSSKDILLAAAKYVQEQGLPTTSAKQDAFKAYMLKALGTEWSGLKESEQNVLLEAAVAIFKKISG
jgi:hypothetical protein